VKRYIRGTWLFHRLRDGVDSGWTFSWVLLLAPAIHYFALHEAIGTGAALLAAASTGIVVVWAMAAQRVRWISHARNVRRAMSVTFRQVESLLRLQRLLGGESLPPMRNWAVSPDAAELLVLALLERKPRCVVDLGSGTSTIVMALAARRHAIDSVIVSIDHLAEYAAGTAKVARERGLDELIRLRLAPLGQVAVNGEQRQWYEPTFLGELPTVDLVFVDGPPGVVGVETRYPALPLLRDHLGSYAIVVIDDAARTSERTTISKWRAEFPDFVFEWVPAEKGCCIGYRGPRPKFLDARLNQ